jgi:hypothetical protein
MLTFVLVAFACSFILLPNVDADLTSLAANKLAGIENEDVTAEGKDIEDVQVEHTGEKRNSEKGVSGEKGVSFCIYSDAIFAVGVLRLVPTAA